MRAFARFRCAVLALVALAVLLALPGGVLAAQPTFRDHFTDTFPDNICGVDGTSSIVVNDVVTYAGTSFKVSYEFTDVFTAVDGRTAITHTAGQVSDHFVDNGDGAATAVNTNKGLPEQIRGGGGGIATQDAGLWSLVFTFDLATGDVISFSVVEHGPHPEADADFAIFCTAFLAALGKHTLPAPDRASARLATTCWLTREGDDAGKRWEDQPRIGLNRLGGGASVNRQSAPAAPSSCPCRR
jgi:hypothetical protein